MIVENYGTDASRRHKEDRWWQAEGSSLEVAVGRAGRAELGGLIHPHQRRLGRIRLGYCATALMECRSELAAAPTFIELHQRVCRAFSPLLGVGELAAYDATDRLAHHLGLAPTLVYLHAGARAGARKILGRRFARGEAWSAFPHEFPAGLCELSSREIEDILCIYKDHFFDTPAQLLRWLGQGRGCRPSHDVASRC